MVAHGYDNATAARRHPHVSPRSERPGPGSVRSRCTLRWARLDRWRGLPAVRHGAMRAQVKQNAPTGQPSRSDVPSDGCLAVAVLEVDYPGERDPYVEGRGLLLVPALFCRRWPIALVDVSLRPVLWSGPASPVPCGRPRYRLRSGRVPARLVSPVLCGPLRLVSLPARGGGFSECCGRVALCVVCG